MRSGKITMSMVATLLLTAPTCEPVALDHRDAPLPNAPLPDAPLRGEVLIPSCVLLLDAVHFHLVGPRRHSVSKLVGHGGRVEPPRDRRLGLWPEEALPETDMHLGRGPRARTVGMRERPSRC